MSRRPPPPYRPRLAHSRLSHLKPKYELTNKGGARSQERPTKTNKCAGKCAGGGHAAREWESAMGTFSLEGRENGKPKRDVQLLLLLWVPRRKTQYASYCFLYATSQRYGYRRSLHRIVRYTTVQHRTSKTLSACFYYNAQLQHGSSWYLNAGCYWRNR
jgi:hypothetical protein